MDQTVPNDDLTSNLKEYIDLSAQTVAVKKELKIIGERRKELEDQILNFMQTNSIDVLKIQGGGSIKLVETKSKAPLNEEYLRESLVEKAILDTQTIDDIINLAFKRPVTQNGHKIRLGKKT